MDHKIIEANKRILDDYKTKIGKATFQGELAFLRQVRAKIIKCFYCPDKILEVIPLSKSKMYAKSQGNKIWLLFGNKDRVLLFDGGDVLNITYWCRVKKALVLIINHDMVIRVDNAGESETLFEGRIFNDFSIHSSGSFALDLIDNVIVRAKFGEPPEYIDYEGEIGDISISGNGLISTVVSETQLVVFDDMWRTYFSNGNEIFGWRIYDNGSAYVWADDPIFKISASGKITQVFKRVPEGCDVRFLDKKKYLVLGEDNSRFISLGSSKRKRKHYNKKRAFTDWTWNQKGEMLLINKNGTWLDNGQERKMISKKEPPARLMCLCDNAVVTYCLADKVLINLV